MTNNFQHQNFDSECYCGALLVAVLYDEASAAERREFERHAATCATCAEEFAAFQVVGNQFAEYRAEVLQPLRAPETFAPQFEAKQTESFGARLLERLRALVFPAGKIWQTGAAFAAFAVCAALIFAVLIAARRDEQQLALKKPDKQTQIQSSNQKLATEPAQTPAPQAQSSQQQIATTTKPAKNVDATTQTTKTAPRAARNKSSAPAAAKSGLTKPRAARPAIELEMTDDEQPEDAAPRLADLLEEIGSIE